MSLVKYLELDGLLTAFKFKDIQSVVTIYKWLAINKATMEDLYDYSRMYPYMTNIPKIGYFHPAPTVEHSKRIKEFEKTLPKDLRVELRKNRWERTHTGKLHE